MNPYSFAVSLFAFTCPLIGFFILLKRRDRASKIYFLFSLFASLWAACVSIMTNNDLSYSQAMTAVRITGVAVAFLSILWLHFVLAYTGYEEKFSLFLKVGYFLEIFAASFSFTDFYGPYLINILSFSHYFKAGVTFHILVVLYFVFVGLGFSLLYKYSQELKKSNDSVQVKGLIIAMFLGYVGGSHILLPSYEISFPQHGLYISDNGPGIDRAQLKRIFQPFYTTKKEGTGLGLYITKQLIERNNGKVIIDSKAGQGTTFVVEFVRP